MRKLILPACILICAAAAVLIWNRGVLLPLFQRGLDRKREQYEVSHPLDLTLPLQEDCFASEPMIRRVVSRELAFTDLLFDMDAKEYYMEYQSLQDGGEEWLKETFCPYPWIHLRENEGLTEDQDLREPEWKTAEQTSFRELEEKLMEYARKHPGEVCRYWNGNILIDRKEGELIELCPQESAYWNSSGILLMKVRRLTEEKEQWLSREITDSEKIWWESSMPVASGEELEKKKTAVPGISERYPLPVPEGIRMEVSEYRRSGSHAAIRVVLYNETEEKVGCFLNLGLEYQINENWYEAVLQENISFESRWFLCPIQPGEKVCGILDPIRQGNLLEPGTYRISQVIFRYNETTGEAEPFGKLSQEFTIE